MATMVRAPFMPTTCWMAPLMPRAKYNLGATVWPELPIWRSMGSQPSSQMGREAAISPPIALASASAWGIFSGALMPRPTLTMMGACVKSTADFASLKRSSGLVRICCDFIYWSFAAGVWFQQISAEGPGLEGREPRAVTLERNVGSGFTLEHLADE